MSDEDDVAGALDALHAKVQRRADMLAARHAARLQCRLGCSACCTDDRSVLGVEADAIRRHAGARLLGASPHPAGGCAFLDADGACRIYAARPYICRTQGLPLRWFEEDEDEEIIERRDICPLNLDGEPLEVLAEDDLWWIGPVELELLRLDDARGGGERVELRSLFAELAGRADGGHGG